jgi:hypothetical protein
VADASVSRILDCDRFSFLAFRFPSLYGKRWKRAEATAKIFLEAAAHPFRLFTSGGRVHGLSLVAHHAQAMHPDPTRLIAFRDAQENRQGVECCPAKAQGLPQYATGQTGGLSRSK